MLNLLRFSVGDISLQYHGKYNYWLYEKDNSVEMTVDILSADGQRIIDEQYYVFSAVSTAISAIEAIENGEEI